MAAAIEVFHADSLAGPMKALKGAFETRNPGARVNLTTGRSQELAERILKGDVCDVFTPSAPAVIEKDLMTKKVAGTDRIGASWSVIFSANEMVVITAKGNPLGIKKMSDLAKPGMRFTRVTGEKDMATRAHHRFCQERHRPGRQSATGPGDHRRRHYGSGKTPYGTGNDPRRRRRKGGRRGCLLLRRRGGKKRRRQSEVSRRGQPQQRDTQRRHDPVDGEGAGHGPLLCPVHSLR